MKPTSPNEELEHLVRAVSHDMSANFMLLEDSFSQLKKSLAQFLQSPPEADELGERVAHVEACLHGSRRFLDDLVWLARTGRVEMEPGRVELAAVVDEVLFEQQESLAEHHVEVEVLPPLPVLWCNQGRLKQIVTNLVRNAVHHGCDPEHPRITIAPAVPTDAAGASQPGAAAFRIHDNGPGIDRRFCREIFLPGRRLRGAGADGSGMGLAIVRKIVDHYGGSVFVDPDCDAGTAFVVCLPGAPAEAARAAAPAEIAPEADGHPWNLQLDGRHEERPKRPRPARSSQPHHRG
jgi:signal transduction histidine kinase